ncbi:STAS domain-containing protein [Pseudalkalibacillus hwajinpoensis]|uniref:STAS domain-containing protein n=1 Tax=Guptibacillus hwajinpoensis TaxID=208199 RepID=UPI001CD30064|nr:STAS domain-containing protein [Pseudalkalibacillus hwajinpoensis]MCA0992084.1 STAS domain-containing protein [Pseudalkalibacillus hwajinpoensis]
MQRNKELHQFLLTKAEQLTEDWYASLDKSGTGVYASTDPEVIRELKSQNFEFHQHLCKIFIMEKSAFFAEFDDWVQEIGRDPEHLNTPTHLIMKEFQRVREQYMDFIEEYSKITEDLVSQKSLDIWKYAIIEAIDVVMTRVVEEKSKHLNSRIEEQQQTINELSSPLIDLPDGKALLPLVGDIDSDRATAIFENTLEGCTTKRVDHLFIDLSGVYLVDTRVAQQIFQLITGLKLIGVTATLSGIRPEIAQTAVQLGIDFGEIRITSNLAQAISSEATLTRD